MVGRFSCCVSKWAVSAMISRKARGHLHKFVAAESARAAGEMTMKYSPEYCPQARLKSGGFWGAGILECAGMKDMPARAGVIAGHQLPEI